MEPTWKEIIHWAEKRGHFTTGERRAAGRWDSCACRDLPEKARYPEENGEPVDDSLLHLGTCFAVAVEHNDFTLAREIDRNIRRRIENGEYETRESEVE